MLPYAALMLLRIAVVEVPPLLARDPTPQAADVLGVHAAQKGLEGPLVDSVEAARLVLRAATGEDRAPRRQAPRPRLFQYFPLHDRFS